MPLCLLPHVAWQFPAWTPPQLPILLEDHWQVDCSCRSCVNQLWPLLPFYILVFHLTGLPLSWPSLLWLPLCPGVPSHIRLTECFIWSRRLPLTLCHIVPFVELITITLFIYSLSFCLFPRWCWVFMKAEYYSLLCECCLFPRHKAWQEADAQEISIKWVNEWISASKNSTYPSKHRSDEPLPKPPGQNWNTIPLYCCRPLDLPLRGYCWQFCPYCFEARDLVCHSVSPSPLLDTGPWQVLHSVYRTNCSSRTRTALDSHNQEFTSFPWQISYSSFKAYICLHLPIYVHPPRER